MAAHIGGRAPIDHTDINAVKGDLRALQGDIYKLNTDREKITQKTLDHLTTLLKKLNLVTEADEINSFSTSLKKLKESPEVLSDTQINELGKKIQGVCNAVWGKFPSKQKETKYSFESLPDFAIRTIMEPLKSKDKVSLTEVSKTMKKHTEDMLFSSYKKEMNRACKDEYEKNMPAKEKEIYLKALYKAEITPKEVELFGKGSWRTTIDSELITLKDFLYKYNYFEKHETVKSIFLDVKSNEKFNGNLEVPEILFQLKNLIKNTPSIKLMPLVSGSYPANYILKWMPNLVLINYEGDLKNLPTDDNILKLLQEVHFIDYRIDSIPSRLNSLTNLKKIVITGDFYVFEIKTLPPNLEFLIINSKKYVAWHLDKNVIPKLFSMHTELFGNEMYYREDIEGEIIYKNWINDIGQHWKKASELRKKIDYDFEKFSLFLSQISNPKEFEKFASVISAINKLREDANEFFQHEIKRFIEKMSISSGELYSPFSNTYVSKIKYVSFLYSRILPDRVYENCHLFTISELNFKAAEKLIFEATEKLLAILRRDIPSLRTYEPDDDLDAELLDTREAEMKAHHKDRDLAIKSIITDPKVVEANILKASTALTKLSTQLETLKKKTLQVKKENEAQEKLYPEFLKNIELASIFQKEANEAIEDVKQKQKDFMKEISSKEEMTLEKIAKINKQYKQNKARLAMIDSLLEKITDHYNKADALSNRYFLSSQKK